MIHQLLLNTLFACQPKTETEIPTSMIKPEEATVESEPKIPLENSSTIENQEEATSRKNIVFIVKELSEPKINEENTRFYSGSVKVGSITYPRTSLTDEQFCNKICSSSYNSGYKRLINVENCQVELLENWEELRKDFSWEKAREQGNPVVGTVECNADIAHIKKGRAGLSVSQGSKVADDIGGYFARAAQEEMTAVFAFQEMLENLKSFDAPQQLLDDCERAICDERRHMIMMSNMAKRHGCSSAIITLPKQKSVSLFELAKHNAIAGCIEETWAALIAIHQSKHTKHYSKLFDIIAKDEVFHAQLSWDIHEWLMTRLSKKEQQKITEIMKQHIEKFSPTTSTFVDLGAIPPRLEKQIWTEFSTQLRLKHIA